MQNCIPCALYPLYRFGTLARVTSIIPTCEHHNNSKPDSYFYISTNCLITEIIVLCFLISSLPLYVHSIMESDNEFSLQLLAEALYCANSVQIMISELFKKKLKASILNNWTTIVKNCTKYHIKVLLPEDGVKSVRRLGCFYCFLTALLISNLIYWEISVHPFSSVSEIITITASIIATFIHALIATQLLIEAVLFKVILVTWQDILREILNGRLALDIRFGKMNRVYRALIGIMKSNEKYISPSGVYWLILILLILIINIYILIVLWTRDADNTFNIILHLRTCGVVGIIVQFEIHIFRLEKTVSTLYFIPYRGETSLFNYSTFLFSTQFTNCCIF